MTTFTLRCAPTGTGLRVAVKDLIDMEGIPTTAGCRAVQETAGPAEADAVCLAGARASARLVGRTNLHELALGVTGINPWFGTPVNPLDPRRVPGGSSSGAAVAVMTDEADVAYGSDTGGSVRIPAACCGCAGLKTTWGRIPTEGVWPLAQSLDTIGPLARDVRGLVDGMRLLDPAFGPLPDAAHLRVGVMSGGGDPLIEDAVAGAVRAAGWEVSSIVLPGWREATAAAGLVLVAEAWEVNRVLVTSRPASIGEDVLRRLAFGRDAPADQVTVARAVRERWKRELAEAFTRVDVIATPTLTVFPPELERGEELLDARLTLPVNFAGVPALSLPVPAAGRSLPASLQLIGPEGGDELLLAAGAVVEAAVSAG